LGPAADIAIALASLAYLHEVRAVLTAVIRI
jgi:hypothetical protein